MATAGLFGFTSLQVLYLHDELDFEPSSKIKWADANLMTELSEAMMKQRDDTDDKRIASELKVVHEVVGYVHEFVRPNGATKLQSLVDRRFHR